MSFKELGLSAPILKAVTAQGYSEPSPIQAKAIPAVLEGHDLMAAAQTGTGKTAGFTLPILERLSGANIGLETDLHLGGGLGLQASGSGGLEITFEK